MHVSLKHLIGTVALISLILAAGFSYTVFTSFMEAEVYRRQLHQVAEYVALNLVELINLVNFSNHSSKYPIFKVLRLPHALGEKAYIIELLNLTSQGKGCYVKARLVTRNDVEAYSPILINTTEIGLELKAFNTTNIPPVWEGWKGYHNVSEKEDEGKIWWSESVYGDAGEIVVWGVMYDTSTAGIGIWKRGGG